jgi:leucyl aminopeptidase
LPGNICTPTYLADRALKIASQYANLSAEILEEADMQKLGMGSFLSVSRGSRQDKASLSAALLLQSLNW